MALQSHEKIILVEFLHLPSGEHQRRGGGDECVEVSVQRDEEFCRT